MDELVFPKRIFRNIFQHKITKTIQTTKFVGADSPFADFFDRATNSFQDFASFFAPDKPDSLARFFTGSVRTGIFIVILKRDAYRKNDPKYEKNGCG